LYIFKYGFLFVIYFVDSGYKKNTKVVNARLTTPHTNYLLTVNLINLLYDFVFIACIMHAGKKYKLGKIQFIGGRKGFTLCRCNEYGITNLKENRLVKTTSIYREYRLRIDSRALGQEYHDLSKQGFQSWAAYKEHRESIKASVAAIHHALKRYKDRRIEAGSFYMLNHPTLNAL
jgi:hypothetical protein